MFYLRSTSLRILGLRWADMVMEGTFFLMQIYLTDVWKFNFTTASAILNIWGGIYRILPIFFLVLADTFLGNFLTLTFSAISSTTGLVFITVSALPVHRCRKKEAAECVGHTEKGLFIVGMALIALGRASRFASFQPFMQAQDEAGRHYPARAYSVVMFFILFPLSSVIVNFIFPYAKKWYLLFGVSAICTFSATVFYLSGCCCWRYMCYVGPKPDGSPIIDIFRVFVAAAFKISHPLPQDNTQLHRIQDEEFSPSRVLRFLHKAAIKLPGEEAGSRSSWRLCSVQEVQEAKKLIRMVPVWCCYIMCGVASSTGSTFFVEQITHMKYKIGAWEPPAQVLLSLFLLTTMLTGEDEFRYFLGFRTRERDPLIGGASMIFSIICFTVAAAVERRRLHVGARHHLLDQPHAKIPLNAGWLFFQVFFLALVESSFVLSLTTFHSANSSTSMKGLQNCIIEGVTGVGFMCSALLVYVVGQISETGGNNNWFHPSLNMSRLDRYYWVLAALFSVNLIVYIVVRLFVYKGKQTREGAEEEEEDD